MNYNKLPFKERQRHLQYQFNQTERQEEIMLQKEWKRIEEEKRRCYEEQRTMSDKERQEEEVFARLRELVGEY